MRALRIGPGLLVAAAFIGPGTVTTATLAGANHGYALGWGIAFSTLATVVLQEMSARLGVGARLSLGEALRAKAPTRAGFAAVAAVSVAAIFVGNVAYEGGNLRGAVLGARRIPGLDVAEATWLVGIAALAGALLWAGRLAWVQNLLGALIAGLSLAYFAALAHADTDWAALATGLLPLRLPTGAEATVIALVGTTVVPYNLFLHASAARAYYPDARHVGRARVDTYVSVALGGLVTLAISAVAAAATAGEHGGSAIVGIEDLSRPLGGLLGDYAAGTLAAGYLAAGLSSAITAPLAAAYAVSGLFGWGDRLADRRLRLVWAAVLAGGVAFALLDIRPVPLIFVAQVANGLLLPAVAGLLLWCVNDAALLGHRVNGRAANLAGALTLLVAAALGARALLNALS